MSLCYVEILQESRPSNRTPTSVDWSLSLQFKLPLDEDGEVEVPTFDAGEEPPTPESPEELEIIEQVDDIKAAEIAQLLLPPGRWMPDFYGNPVFLVLQSFAISQVNNSDWWMVKAEYLYDLNSGAGSSGGAASDAETLPFIRVNFSTGNRTKTITQSKELLLRSVPDTVGPHRPAPDTGTAIGVTVDGVAGTEVYDSSLTLQITAFYFPDKVTNEFVTRIKKLVAHTNTEPFLGQDPGEVLLIGADGGGAVNEVIPITFTVEVKENLVDEPDPPFAAITTNGHNIVDYRYEKKADQDGSKLILQLPTSRFIHRVYDEADLTVLGFPQ